MDLRESAGRGYVGYGHVKHIKLVGLVCNGIIYWLHTLYGLESENFIVASEAWLLWEHMPDVLL